MAKRLTILMAALLVLGFVVAGCGSDDNSSDSGDTAAQPITDTDTVTDDETVTDTDTDTVTDENDTDVTSDDNGGAVVQQSLEQAVERCKENIDKAQQLSADTKDSLQEICEKAGSGNAEDVQKAAAEVCKKMAGDSIPEGTPGRDQALAACDRAGQQ
jgi:ABC-type glycerol-3-phosphate transport system substrate-binding protein